MYIAGAWHRENQFLYLRYITHVLPCIYQFSKYLTCLNISYYFLSYEIKVLPETLNRVFLCNNPWVWDSTEPSKYFFPLLCLKYNHVYIYIYKVIPILHCNLTFCTAFIFSSKLLNIKLYFSPLLFYYFLLQLIIAYQ